MNLKQNILIFSVYQSNQDLSTNLKNHNQVMQDLEAQGLPVSELQGMYKGSPEKSILVVGLENRESVEALVTKYDQECYLESHNDRSTNLVYPNGTKQSIGTLTNVSIGEALKHDSYSFNDQGYFICKDK